MRDAVLLHRAERLSTQRVAKLGVLACHVLVQPFFHKLIEPHFLVLASAISPISRGSSAQIEIFRSRSLVGVLERRSAIRVVSRTAIYSLPDDAKLLCPSE
jgi:hypothetical protein